MGFLGPEPRALEELGVLADPRGNADAPTYATSADGVFAAADARGGQSLIVWAINEGRGAPPSLNASSRLDMTSVALQTATTMTDRAHVAFLRAPRASATLVLVIVLLILPL